MIVIKVINVFNIVAGFFGALMNAKLDEGKWCYWKSEIFNKPFLTVQDGKDKGTPLRTHKSGVWQNGYGDHYPTLIYLIKQKK